MKKQPRPLSAQELQAIEDLKAKISVRKAAEKNGLKPTKVFELRKRYLSDNATVQAEASDSSSNIPVAVKGDGNPPSSPPAKAKKKKHLSAEERNTIQTTLREMQAEGAGKSLSAAANESDVPAMWVAAINCRLRLKVNRQQEAELKTELGFHLMAAKARLEHGEWLKQLRLYCPIHERTSERYMGLAAYCIPVEYRKFDRLSNSTEPVELPTEARAAMKKKIKGRTVQTLYEKAGIVSPPKPDPKEPTVADAAKAIGEIVKQLKSYKNDPDKAVADQAQALLARMKEAKGLLSDVGSFLEDMTVKAQSPETDE